MGNAHQKEDPKKNKKNANLVDLLSSKELPIKKLKKMQNVDGGNLLTQAFSMLIPQQQLGGGAQTAQNPL